MSTRKTPDAYFITGYKPEDLIRGLCTLADKEPGLLIGGCNLEKALKLFNKHHRIGGLLSPISVDGKRSSISRYRISHTGAALTRLRNGQEIDVLKLTATAWDKACQETTNRTQINS